MTINATLRGERKGFLFKAVLLAGGATALLAFYQRERLVLFLPALSPVYGAAGVPVNLDRLMITGLRGRIIQDGGGAYLAVEGSIANPSRATAIVPRLNLSIRSPEGRSIYQWTAEAGAAKLKPGEKTMFRARLATPPAGGTEIAARFADGGG